ncbi:hypothetical protein ZIOFF_029920 [Zingiber officinale]|uniref:C2 domain-containing protein n=1 Tax=Zingiber officinale TaxID=94328 RepID=A0A8J5LES3_ZINOF|nr:hypothetical protein ZIOFF_029920 [Zingiber officinale]
MIWKQHFIFSLTNIGTPIVYTGAGSEPEWNETFVFTVSDSVTNLTIKLFDKDTFSSDDFVGEAKIPLDPVFVEGSIPSTIYNVVKDQEYCGQIKVGLTFTPVSQSPCSLYSKVSPERGIE